MVSKIQTIPQPDGLGQFKKLSSSLVIYFMLKKIAQQWTSDNRMPDNRMPENQMPDNQKPSISGHIWVQILNGQTSCF
jgi:hypothetical protein